MSARLEQVLDERHETLRWYEHSLQDERMTGLLLNDVVTAYTEIDLKTGEVSARNPSEEAVIDEQTRILNTEVHALREAEVFYVEPDFHKLVLAACETFKPEQLLPSDLIVPCGFVRLPEPINILPAVAEEADEFMAFGHSAFSWMTSSDGIFLSYWHSRDDLRTEVPDIPASAPSLYAGRFCGWSFEMDYWLDSVYLYPRVFFRLVMQRLAQIERVRPDRATRRRIERDGGTVANLNIVRLRRPTGAGAGTGEGSREYTHQWMVGGHWRQQWYASIQSHRQIWISPYVKGPEGTELIIKSRIFDVAV